MSLNRGAPFRAKLFLMAGMLTFGIAAIIVRFGGGSHPFVLAALRTLFATGLVGFYFITTGAYRTTDWKKVPRLVAAGILLGYHFLLWTASLSYTSVAAASVLVTSHPVLLLLVERFFYKRRFSANVWVGVALAITGSIILSMGQPDAALNMPDAFLGNALAFSAALLFVLYALFSSRERQTVDLVPFTMFVYLGSAISCTAAALWVGPGTIPDNVWIAAFALALGPQLVGHGSVAYAVKYFSPTFISTLILVEPLLASVLAFFFFGEQPSQTAMLGMLFVLTGIIQTWRGDLLPKNEPEPQQ